MQKIVFLESKAIVQVPVLRTLYREYYDCHWRYCTLLIFGSSLTNKEYQILGFVYVGEHVHSWLAATQYIAPLMANFDTTTSEDAQVLFADTGMYLANHFSDVG